MALIPDASALNRQNEARAGVVIAAIAISSAAVMVRLCSAPAASIAALRLLISSAGFAIVLLLMRGRWLWSLPRDLRGKCLMSGLFLGFHFYCWITSLQWTTVAVASVLISLNPVFVAVGDGLLFRVKPSRMQITALLIAFAGTLLVIIGSERASAISEGPHVVLGALLAIAGAAFGSANMLTSKLVRTRLTNIEYVTTSYGIAAVLLLVIALVARAPLNGFDPGTWRLIFLIALLPQAVGHTLINWSLAYLPSAQVGIMRLIEPLGSALIAWGILGEKITPIQASGALLVLIGVAMNLAVPASEGSSDGSS